MPIYKRTLAAVAAVTLVLGAASAHSQTAKVPDFSGQWEMNAAKSDLGPMAAAITKLAFTVEQSATALKFTQAVTTVQGDRSMAQDFVLDGKEVTQTGPTGQSVVVAAKPDGDAILITVKVAGSEQGQTMRWTMAPDGKSMTIDQQMSSPMGAMTMKLVLDKK